MIAVFGEFTAAGASAPTLPTSPKGNEITVIADTGVGQYTATFRDTYPQFWNGEVTLLTADNVRGKIVAEDIAGAGTVDIEFRTADTGALVDPTGNVKVMVWVRNSRLGLNNV